MKAFAQNLIFFIIALFLGFVASSVTLFDPWICSFVVLALMVISPRGRHALFSKIGALVTGAGNETSLDKNKLHQFIQIGTIDTDLPITSFAVNIAGETTINIKGQSFVQAFAKLVTAGLLGADVKKSMLLPVSNGSKGNTAVEYTFKNAGVTTPDIYGYGIMGAGDVLPVGAGMVTIDDLSSDDFQDFDYLLVDTTNLDKTSLVFRSGWDEANMTVSELAGLSCLSEDVLDADGKLAGLTVIDGELVASAELFADGGDVSVCVVSLPPSFDDE